MRTVFDDTRSSLTNVFASEILATQSGSLTDLRQRRRTDLFIVVKAEGKVPPPGPLQLAVGADLLLAGPAKSE
jgi:hypothetical protein